VLKNKNAIVTTASRKPLFHKKDQTLRLQKSYKNFACNPQPNRADCFFINSRYSSSHMDAAVGSIVEHGSVGIVVDVECHMSNGLPNIVVVGFGNRAVDEARERVRSSFASSKLDLPA
jgi:hypothetical protein